MCINFTGCLLTGHCVTRNLSSMLRLSFLLVSQTPARLCLSLLVCLFCLSLGLIFYHHHHHQGFNQLLSTNVRKWHNSPFLPVSPACVSCLSLLVFPVCLFCLSLVLIYPACLFCLSLLLVSPACLSSLYLPLIFPACFSCMYLNILII